MNDLWRREWGALLFVGTVLVGAIAVAISFAVAAGRPSSNATPPPCPVYTPYLVTPTVSPAVSATPAPSQIAYCPTPPTAPPPSISPTASPTTSPTASPSHSPTPSPSASPSGSARPSHSPTPSP